MGTEQAQGGMERSEQKETGRWGQVVLGFEPRAVSVSTAYHVRVDGEDDEDPDRDGHGRVRRRAEP